ncbi:bile acid:sodium symporter family protein [Algoriphagus aquimarinus]|uniref:Solute carrier family 10 (Sodium/bile acid cotransporter), member 7 n=1 Tax=Algoriphagus aquimarinus TaxID=237018 RepID=A0A1I1A113_9BACT|nr:bile acid:sodium symporter family protein [Algoriphagus aquimarinus]SFB31252.1 solute carrier family 10 (sodium/bile acid cotransporter), member 7 [Algoriphagus aquimarinus]|tara:strand:+ start:29844 stop:30830 length:987 start_codon:yes stop_codon:yes gene_type:complete
MIKKLASTLNRVGINGFLLGLFAAILLAWLFPFAGSNQSPVPWKPIINIGIGLVFFLYGVKLDPVQLMSGLKNWKLHVLIQLTTFVLFPMIVLAIMPLMTWIDKDFQLGITYLSVLPSTVSASVVMVSIAQGNIPGAIFNASISSLLGVIITPAWMGILADSADIKMDFLPTLGELSIKVLLPVIVGIIAHRWLYPKIQRHLSALKYIDQTVIMIIVFTSFAQSFSQDVFSPYKMSVLFEVGATMLGLFFLVWVVIEVLCRMLGFSWEDRVTALFCGSKKSLVQGVVIGKVIFPDPATLGLVLLPLMLYHIQQLIAGSIIASRFSKKI